DDHAAWPADILDWKTSPVDLSFLNAPEKPAGKRGFLKTQKDKLVFEDGAVARFWGTNLTAYTLKVDLSFLNAPEKPAGKRGFLKTQKDKLVFEDGAVARFWGTNLTAYTLFGTSKEGVKQQARRLSELGFNLVRLVHHDSAW